MAKIESLFSEWVLRYRIPIIIACLGLVGSAIYKVDVPNPTTNYRVFFSSENPELTAFEELEANFSKNDNVLFVISPKDGNVYSKQTLAAINYLSSEEQVKQGKNWKTIGAAWYIPFTTRVDSITNFRHTTASNDELKTNALVIDAQKLTPQDLIKLRKIVESEPTLLKRVVSVKGHVAAVNVTINLPGVNTKTEAPSVVKYSRKLAKEVEQKFPGVKVRLVGMVMFNNAFTEAAVNDFTTLYPLALGLIIIFLVLLLRSVIATVMTLLVMIMSIMTAMGFAMKIGFPITPPVINAPIVILTVAIANSVHILVSFVAELRLGHDRITAIKESLRINITPVFLTSFTTVLGFLTMNFSDVPPFNHMGNIVAMGVAASFIYATCFLPAVLSFIPFRAKKSKSTNTTRIDKFANFIIRQRKPIFWSSLFTIIICISFLPKNVLNDVFLEYFSKKIEVRQHMDYTNKNLTGLYQVDYSVDSGKENGLNNPLFLSDVNKFVTWLRLQKHDVKHVFTFLDTLKRINKTMHNDDPAWYKLPDSSRMTAEYIMMYEGSVPQGFDPKNQVDIKMRATRITLNLRTMSSNELIAFEKRVQEHLKQYKTIKSAIGTGPTMMFSHIGKRNIISMLLGTSIALILISFILIIAFRSVKIGLISMIPNLVPGAMAFGLWGLLDGQIGLGLSIVTGMTLGIVVDDTVHFLSKYLRARREHNANPMDAIRYAFSKVGTALITTSIVLVVGFLIVAMSAFKLNSDMGLLTSGVIILALMADFLFLPTLLMLVEGNKNEDTNDNSSSPVSKPQQSTAR